MESLQGGNRHQVTIDVNGQERKIGIEAAPRFKSLNLYESNGTRIRTDKLYEKQSTDQSQQKSVKQGKDADDSGEMPAKKSKRNWQSIH